MVEPNSVSGVAVSCFLRRKSLTPGNSGKYLCSKGKPDEKRTARPVRLAASHTLYGGNA